MNIKELILKQFQACHHTDTWFVSLHTALMGLNSQQAKAKTQSSTNSIFEIAHHLYFYNQLELQRFKGIDNKHNITDNRTTFHNEQELSWNRLVSELLQTMKEWEAEIERSNSESIEQFYENLTYINLHNAYHIGQIVHIRKLHGNWDEQAGVNYTT
ncbi:DinB family protein [Gracilibacillus kekensis]|uniref:DinB superfamily protein n=1 Tax=Gracilibacillus kekensis TaxID=1027249 RepID=A0A1M7IUG8_9BACI|nr:DinB family protein [Gracilibacillus kekensis]SHM43977.1 DinB superfamily protein [Gracilibacillus kekensis]